MKTKTGILCAAAIAAFIGATALTSGASASIPSSPAERAATAALNRQIAMNNAAEEARYQEQRRFYEEQQRQYEAQLRLQGR